MPTGRQKLSELRDRYDRIVLERYYLMQAGAAFAAMQRKWLPRFRRRNPFGSMEEWVEANDELRRREPDTWWQLQADIGSLSEAYGLAPWQVTWGLFLRGFDPRDPNQAGWLFSLDAWCPQARLVVHRATPQVIEQLVGLSQSTGILVELRPSASSGEEADRAVDLDAIEKVRISLEVPLEYPPDLAVMEARQVLRVSREMLRSAGMRVGMRVRGLATGAGVAAALVTHSKTSSFIQALASACAGSIISLVAEPGQPSIAPISEEGKTPLALVRLRLEFGARVRAADLVAGIRRSIREARGVLENAGLTLGQRLRAAPLVVDSPQLRVDGNHLERRGLGDLVEDVYGFTPRERGRLTPEGRAAVSKTKSRRGRIKQRARAKGLLPP